MELLVIEHLEPCLNRWLMKEYEFAAELFRGRLLFTNVRREAHRRALTRLGSVSERSAVEMFAGRSDVVVLDPRAEEELTPEDLMAASYVIIGGIMGSHPPEGRTWRHITSRMPHAKARNIGKHQYTIAGAAYVLDRVFKGLRVSDIRYVYGLRLSKSLAHGVELEVELPYAFPLDEHGNVVLPEGYVEVVLEHAPVFESRVLAGNHHVCQDE